MTKLNITDTAKADIRETLSYIKDTLCNPKAASAMEYYQISLCQKRF